MKETKQLLVYLVLIHYYGQNKSLVSNNNYYGMETI